MFTVSGNHPLDELRRIAADEVTPRLERLPGVASAWAEGGLDRQIHVVLDPAKVAAFGLDATQIVGAVYRENTQVPGGTVEQGSLEFNIQTRGKYQSVEEIGEVVVAMARTEAGPVPVRLKQVAEVEDTFLESQRVLEVDGVPAVWVFVQKQSGANTVRAAEGVLAAFPEILEEVAADVEFKVIFNQAEFINLALGNLSTTALFGVLITFVVLLFFLRNMRSALIVATAIPLSVIATFGVMDWQGMTLNVLSMAGLALAVGMLVDNAIVVLENIYRLREEGLEAWPAAIQGARSVSTAVVASTLTTVSVFVPVLFVPGIAGVMFRDMAVTICFSLIVSLIVALTFIPLAASRLLGGEKAAAKLEKAWAKDPFRGIRGLYGETLDKTLRNRWTVGVGLVSLILIAAVLAVMLPTEFVQQNDQALIFVQAEAPIGSNLDESYDIMKEVSTRIEDAVPEEARKMVALDLGVGEGFVAMFAKGVHAAVFRVPLVTQGNRDVTQQELEEKVRDALAEVPGVTATVAMPFDAMGGSGDIEVQIRGYDLETSRQIGLELKERFLAEPEVSEAVFSMAEQKPEVRVTFDRIKMAELGLSTAAVGNAISTFFMGRLAGRYAEGGDEHDIVVRFGKEHRLDVSELRRMPVVTPIGVSVPLDNVADVSIGLGPVDITRLDQQRVTRLTLTLAETYVGADGSSGRKDLRGSIGRVRETLDAYNWPDGFTYFIGGTAEDFMESFMYLGLALILSIFLVYMVMASQFESFRQPFIIIFAVPLAAIGVVLMFTITRSTMDMSAMVGAIMLVGIVVNNGIVMIDAANQMRHRGMGRLEAIAAAARIRMRPVLMTSLTTIMAMVPLALEIGEGAEGWGGMAKAVIGGLLVSTFLTLFVVPTMYTFFARKKLKFEDADERAEAALAAEPESAS
jgi:HAE1 family hydrophobic/amphiphilic exporter-1